jgi:hypothetical protein
MAVITLEKGAYLAQLSLAIITAIGVLVSLYFSTRSLREIVRDRHQRQRPHLAFEPGGFQYPIVFVKDGPKGEELVRVVAKEIWVGDERFEINQRKRQEPIYALSNNQVPTHPIHILPDGEAGLTHLPEFIVRDYEKKITRAVGVLLIETRDVFDSKIRFESSFRIVTNYKDANPNVIVTFGDHAEDYDECYCDTCAGKGFIQR